VVDVPECGLGARCFKYACVAAHCASDAQCSDGIFCNGAEHCGPATATNPVGCLSGPPPCDGNHACYEDTRSCSVMCTVDDQDGDGHRAIACGGDDCDDTDPNRYPGNLEVCDSAGHDEDCDPTTFGPDLDHDGFVSDACCQKQPGGTLACGLDCDDTNPYISPLALETCDGVDNNCNGFVDEGVKVSAYFDGDLDGFGTGTPVPICPQGLGPQPDGGAYAIYAGDCDDKNPAIFPGQMVCQDPQFPTKVQICLSDGGWFVTDCLKGQACFLEPNGTGTCR